MSDRKKAIEILSNPNKWNEYSVNEIEDACRFAVASLETDEAYQLAYEQTTKNDLAVDAVSRQVFIDWLKNWTLGDASPLIDFVSSMPSVTPQEPKTGHWILSDVEGSKVWRCSCSKCNKDPIRFVGGSENWWLIKSNLPKYCPNCGCRMVESQESENKE